MCPGLFLILSRAISNLEIFYGLSHFSTSSLLAPETSSLLAPETSSLLAPETSSLLAPRTWSFFGPNFFFTIGAFELLERILVVYRRPLSLGYLKTRKAGGRHFFPRFLNCL